MSGSTGGELEGLELTPFRLHSKKDPYPSSRHLQNLQTKDPALEVIPMIQMRAELQTPRHPQYEIQDDCCVIHGGGVELGGPS